MADAVGDILRSFVKAFESRDVDKTVGHFMADAVYETPSGTFKGTVLTNGRGSGCSLKRSGGPCGSSGSLRFLER